MAIVPCGACRQCCMNNAIVLHPEDGDVVQSYDCEPWQSPVSGKTELILKRKPNGECVYLGLHGCTIHGRAPVICREFDCRLAFLKFTRNERRRLIKTNMFDQETFDAGRKRLGSLP